MTETVAVVGLGYVGVPLAAVFAEEGYDVVGYDVDDAKVDALAAGTDPTDTLPPGALADGTAEFTTNPAALADADYVVITVPTPVTDSKDPDLHFVEAAGRSVGEHLTPDTTVVLESTVYPGATEEVLVPALEEASGMTCGEDFYVGYSPERSAAGDGAPGLRDVVKIVSGLDDTARERVASLYGDVVDAGTYVAQDVKTAEAAKLVENVQRDVNIALTNELAMAFDHMGIDTHAVLDAASTKWNFHAYEPGLVGGHCIPVDPYYFVHAAERSGYSPDLTLAGRAVNSALPDHVVDLTTRALEDAGITVDGARVLVLGLTFKPDVGDTRCSGVDRIFAGLSDAGVRPAGYDPYVPVDVVREEYGAEAPATLDPAGYDALVVTTAHSVFNRLDPDTVAEQLGDPALVVDVDGGLGDGWRTSDAVTYRRL